MLAWQSLPETPPRGARIFPDLMGGNFSESKKEEGGGGWKSEAHNKMRKLLGGATVDNIEIETGEDRDQKGFSTGTAAESRIFWGQFRAVDTHFDVGEVVFGETVRLGE